MPDKRLLAPRRVFTQPRAIAAITTPFEPPVGTGVMSSPELPTFKGTVKCPRRANPRQK